jgi:hypothetical protein
MAWQRETYVLAADLRVKVLAAALRIEARSQPGNAPCLQVCNATGDLTALAAACQGLLAPGGSLPPGLSADLGYLALGLLQRGLLARLGPALRQLQAGGAGAARRPTPPEEAAAQLLAEQLPDAPVLLEACFDVYWDHGERSVGSCAEPSLEEAVAEADQQLARCAGAAGTPTAFCPPSPRLPPWSPACCVCPSCTCLPCWALPLPC